MPVGLRFRHDQLAVIVQDVGILHQDLDERRSEAFLRSPKSGGSSADDTAIRRRNPWESASAVQMHPMQSGAAGFIGA
jgi:hypothetical protein